MPNHDASCKTYGLKDWLDAKLLRACEEAAHRHGISLNDWVERTLSQSIQKELSKNNRLAKKEGLAFDAPLDAFLPDGANPFTPLKSVEGSASLATSFEDIQTRMRFSGTTALLRDEDLY